MIALPKNTSVIRFITPHTTTPPQNIVDVRKKDILKEYFDPTTPISKKLSPYNFTALFMPPWVRLDVKFEMKQNLPQQDEKLNQLFQETLKQTKKIKDHINYAGYLTQLFDNARVMKRPDFIEQLLPELDAILSPKIESWQRLLPSQLNTIFSSLYCLHREEKVFEMIDSLTNNIERDSALETIGLLMIEKGMLAEALRVAEKIKASKRKLLTTFLAEDLYPLLRERVLILIQNNISAPFEKAALLIETAQMLLRAGEVEKSQVVFRSALAISSEIDPEWGSFTDELKAQAAQGMVDTGLNKEAWTIAQKIRRDSKENFRSKTKAYILYSLVEQNQFETALQYVLNDVEKEEKIDLLQTLAVAAYEKGLLDQAWQVVPHFNALIEEKGRIDKTRLLLQLLEKMTLLHH